MRPTVFTLVHLVFLFAAGMIGFLAGNEVSGLSGAIVGGTVGAVCGYLAGITVTVAGNRQLERRYRRKPSQTLRAELNEAGISASYISTLIISILRDRGDDSVFFRNYIFRQLRSTDVCERRAGVANLSLCFPEQAAQLKDFNTFTPSEDDLNRLIEIGNSLSSGFMNETANRSQSETRP